MTNGQDEKDERVVNQQSNILTKKDEIVTVPHSGLKISQDYKTKTGWKIPQEYDISRTTASAFKKYVDKHHIFELILKERGDAFERLSNNITNAKNGMFDADKKIKMKYFSSTYWRQVAYGVLSSFPIIGIPSTVSGFIDSIVTESVTKTKIKKQTNLRKSLVKLVNESIDEFHEIEKKEIKKKYYELMDSLWEQWFLQKSKNGVEPVNMVKKELYKIKKKHREYPKKYFEIQFLKTIFDTIYPQARYKKGSVQRILTDVEALKGVIIDQTYPFFVDNVAEIARYISVNTDKTKWSSIRNKDIIINGNEPSNENHLLLFKDPVEVTKYVTAIVALTTTNTRHPIAIFSMAKTSEEVIEHLISLRNKVENYLEKYPKKPGKIYEKL